MTSGLVTPPTYPWSLLRELGSKIGHGELSAAQELLDGVLDIIQEPPSSRLTLRKLRCAQVISLSLRGAHHGGAPSSGLLNHHFLMLQALEVAPSWKAVRVLMHQYVRELVDQVDPRRRVDVQEFVQWISDDMRMNLATGRSLGDYAELGKLSVGHLSRTFKRIVGRSFRDEQRRVRMEEARALLTQSDLKIEAIVRRLGVRDASQFSRDFRRWSGKSPTEFRTDSKRRVSSPEVRE